LSAVRDDLAEEARQIRALFDEKKWPEALVRARRLLVQARAEGVHSAQAMWLVGVAADMAGGRTGEALAAAHGAVEADPLCPEYLHSLQVILNRCREAFAPAAGDRQWGAA